MFLDPVKAIQDGWIKFPEWMDALAKEKCVQPNAIDFTLDRIYSINYNNVFEISETDKKMRGGGEIMPLPIAGAAKLNGQLGWALHDNQMYDCLSDFFVELPEGVAAMMVTRSTFVRNGMFWISGLFDSGFKGHIGGVLHNRAGGALVAKGTRVGQIIFVASNSAGLYAGGWNHQQGTHYAETK